MTNNPKKKINIFLPLTSSAEQQLVWPPNHWRESNICSKLKFLDQNLNRHHSPPALKPPPRFSPRQEKKIKSKYKKKICLRLWSISVNFCFCLSYSLIVFQNNPQPPFFCKSFNFIISRSLSYPLLSRLKNGGSVLIKPISDNTLFSNRSPIMGVADFIWLPRPSAQPHSR
jgi:hypothetical protein